MYEAIELTSFPQNLGQLEDIASRFVESFRQDKQVNAPQPDSLQQESQSGTKPPFIHHNPAQDFNFYLQLMEETGIPVGHSEKDQQHYEALLSLLQPGILKRTTRVPTHRALPDDVPITMKNGLRPQNEIDRPLNYQDALLSLLTFGASLPTTAQHLYTNMLKKRPLTQSKSTINPQTMRRTARGRLEYQDMKQEIEIRTL
ncbi:hypothetical protein SLS60_002055 [Paraconiothyrium brasiliense]|uniref:Uncharacterized protein n=1 Tax=Paraconiothyrium brasiliense TaxID=300254 RepID=A0ABR3S121_9PLEO